MEGLEYQWVGKKSPMFFLFAVDVWKDAEASNDPSSCFGPGVEGWIRGPSQGGFPSWGYPIAGGFTPCSYGHLPVYNWL